ncbi:MAG TPA: putative glycolipid-binding domain-containing protein [Thermomicrobiales bacterium]|nr:putative glycolipid-binding domain-containing protein [Thermomicrobiales bacterium]
MISDVIWSTWDDTGYEQVRIDDGHPGWTVFDSMFVRVDDGAVRRGGYTLICDKAWRALEIRLMVEQAPGSMAARHLLATGDGRWTDADGVHLPALDGCVDIDIAWTPLTNTLPIRRLSLQPGQEEIIRVVYLPLPSLEIGVWEQRYTGLEPGAVRYESLASDFRRDLTVDSEGFVIDYPGLFRRRWPLADRDVTS